jgi:hypothetical protein
MEAAHMPAASSNMHASGRSRLSCSDKRSHQGQSGQTRYGRSGYGVSHRGELQSFRGQRRKAEKVPFPRRRSGRRPEMPLGEALSA